MRDDNNPAEKSKKKYGFVERILLLLPPTIFLIFTFAIYMPSSLFISNIDDFALDYKQTSPFYNKWHNIFFYSINNLRHYKNQYPGNYAIKENIM